VTLPDSDLRIVNDHDLTFAAARTDAASLDLMLRSAGRCPTPSRGRWPSPRRTTCSSRASCPATTR
jgi:hypothetical protein